MASVLLTAFEPYGPWAANSSWLCLRELMRELPPTPSLTTRLYPVDFVKVRQRLEADLAAGFDYVLHLGQSPESTHIALEMFALNIGVDRGDVEDALRVLEPSGPAAYRSTLPLTQWAAQVQQAGIPAKVSFHAGTYLCNACLYWTHFICEEQGHNTQAAFIHLPLETSQAASEPRALPSLPVSMTAAAVRMILADLMGATA